MEIEHNLKFLGGCFLLRDIWIVTGISLARIWLLYVFSEAAEKEVQNTSCRGSGGVPKIGGFGG
jgi:hypothetical protein